MSDWWLLCICLLGLISKVGADPPPLSTAESFQCQDPINTILDTSVLAPQEYSVLEQLYDGLDGESWIWGMLPGVPWNFTSQSDPCVDRWQGVDCTETPLTDGYQHVQQLVLDELGLVGILPESIDQLTELQTLSMTANAVSGPVPPSMGNLTNLQYLYLGSNLFQGWLPEALGHLVNLKELDVSANLLSGPMPDISQLVLLSYLDVSKNTFYGALPSYLGSLASLETLVVQYNQFTGSLPESLGNLSKLQTLVADDNHLTGTIPASLGQLANLQTLALYRNKLTGAIPEALSNLSSVQLLYLYSNSLNGTIPNSFGRLRSLTTLSLQTNALEGTIPSSLCNVTTLVALRAFTNSLTGTLPACLTLNPAFSVLVLYANHLSGPLPSVYANNSAMNFLDVNQPNAFTGTLPESMGQLRDLNSIYVGGNLITGTIPPSYGNASLLQVLYVDFNRLTGTLPETLGSLSELQLMETSGNLISGSLPPSWAGLLSLQELHLDENYITGSLLDSFMQWSKLTVLNVFDNLLRGTVPQRLGDLRRLQYVGLDSNMFTGSLPSTLGQLNHVLNFEAYRNRLTGTLPPCMSNMTALVNLLLHQNHLRGPLDYVFNSTTQRGLTVVQMSDNRLSGTLPKELFKLPSLITVALVTNCFHGSLPRSLCSTATVEVLALSGLQAAKVCQQQLLPGLAKSYLIKRPFTGGIPACLFQVPTLSTLQLSGNGLTGELPPSIEVSNALRALSLSHNQLSGTIPPNFQQRSWWDFDVSYNRLGGILVPEIDSQDSDAYNATAASSALSTQNNRLSGRVPSVLRDFVNISVLDGNLFGCRFDQADLPTHDAAVNNYQCGSGNFDVPFYVWLSVSVIAVLLACWAYRRSNPRADAVQPNAFSQLVASARLLSSFEGIDSAAIPLLNLRYVMALYGSVGRLAAVCTAYAALLLLPLYVVLSNAYGTVVHQYAYTAAATFFSGTVPLALVMPALILMAGLVVACCTLFWQTPDARVVQRDLDRSEAQAKRVAQSSLLSRVAVYCALLVANTFIVCGANIAYVYIALYEDSGLLLFAQILLSLFKLGWNKFCASRLIPLTARYVAPSVSSDLRAAAIHFFPLQLWLSLFNNIVIPCVVVMVISPNCFYYVLSHSPTVTSRYVVNQCLVISSTTGVCSSYFRQEETTTFDPPFTYSYECSASFVTYYAPAFVITCVINTFCVPLAQAVLVALHTRAVEAYTRTGRLSWPLLLLDAALPSLLKPPGFALVDLAQTEPDRQSVLEVSRWTTVQRDVSWPLFPAAQILLSMFTFLGILLTFGAVFPPLAAAVLLTIVGIVVYTRVKVGRFMQAALASKQHRFLQQIDQECRGVGALDALVRSAFLLVLFSCAFYTLFLFDMLGDVYGLERAYWVLIVTPCLPLPLVLLHGYKTARGPAAQPSPTLKQGSGEDAVVAMTRVEDTSISTQSNPDSEEGRVNATFSALHDDQL